MEVEGDVRFPFLIGLTDMFEISHYIHQSNSKSRTSLGK